jgi:hypothetical protein
MLKICYEAWYNFCNINIANFISTFKQRLIGEFLQDCKGVIERSSLLVYKAIVDSFAFEQYLDMIT